MSESLDELDRLCAKYFFPERMVMGDPYIIANQGSHFEHLADWQPTRNISQAWEVLEKFNHPAQGVRVSKKPGDIDYSAEIRNCSEDEIYGAHANTAPLAIVRACLKAKGLL